MKEADSKEYKPSKMEIYSSKNLMKKEIFHKFFFLSSFYLKPLMFPSESIPLNFL